MDTVAEEIDAPPNHRLVYDGRILHVHATVWGSQSQRRFDAALCAWSSTRIKHGRKKGGIYVNIIGPGQGNNTEFQVDAEHADSVMAWLDRWLRRPGASGPANPGTTRSSDSTDDSSTDLTDRLAKLAQLHAQGALTDTEFAEAKTKLLRDD